MIAKGEYMSTKERDETLGMLREAARDFCSAELKRPVTNALGLRALWTQMTQLGWLGVSIPESSGGSGLGLTGAGMIALELGAAAQMRGFAETVAVSAVLSGQNTPLAQSLLQQVVSGEIEFAFDPQPHPQGAASSAGVLLAPAGASRLLLIDFSEAHGLRLLEVADPKALQPALTTARSIDARVAGFALRPVGLLADSKQALALWGEMNTNYRCVAGALLVGSTRSALRIAIDYARVRLQFGQLIGSFQAVQHALVDVLGAVDAAELLSLRALLQLDKRAGDRMSIAAASISFTREIAWSGLMKVYDVMGGVGFIEDHPLSGMTRALVSLISRIGGAAECDRAVADFVRPGHWIESPDASLLR